MKKIYILLIALFVVISACQRSQFPTTTRQYKNGRVSYINTYHKERSKTSKGKSPKNHLKETDTQNSISAASSINKQSIINAEITEINPAPISDNNLISSTANEPIITTKNGNRLVPDNELDFSHKNHSNKKTDNFSPNTSKLNSFKNQKTKTKVHNTKKIEPFGLTGFILSILSWIPVIGLLFPSAASWMFFAGLLSGIFAMVFGAIGLRIINRNQGKYKGKGFAIASIIIGILAFFSSIIILIVAISNLSLG
jgi:hypothetical protein